MQANGYETGLSREAIEAAFGRSRARSSMTAVDIVNRVLDPKRRRVSYRTYGAHGEHRRPIIHRFDIKGGDRVIDIMAANITQGNSLLRMLTRKGKH